MSQTPSAEPTPKRLLYVEPDEGLRSPMTEILERRDHVVIPASTKHAALSALEQNQVDLVLMGETTPTSDKEALVTHIRGAERGVEAVSSMPIVILSSSIAEQLNTVLAVDGVTLLKYPDDGAIEVSQRINKLLGLPEHPKDSNTLENALEFAQIRADYLPSDG